MLDGASNLELLRGRTTEQACPYLPAESASMDFRVILGVTAEVFEPMLERGWRRFGIEFFRPACRNCAKCVSIRVPVEQFQPGKSQGRTLRANAPVRLVVQPPTVTEAHVSLWNRYHQFMATHRSWPARDLSEAAYYHSFVEDAPDFAREFLYFDGAQLIGVGLVDVLPQSISSAYFYHEPTLRQRALGVYSVLKEIEYAREHNLRHHYLGYWISECVSMAYKAQYRPHELLQGAPDIDQTPVWKSSAG